MSIATYRGVKYDTKNVMEKSKDWKMSLESKQLDDFNYRGVKYKWEEQKKV